MKEANSATVHLFGGKSHDNMSSRATHLKEERNVMWKRAKVLIRE